MGGYNSPCNKYLKSCEKYHVLEDRWTPMAEMAEQKAALSALHYQKKFKFIYFRYILAFGGFNGKNRLTTIEQFDIEKNIWIQLPLKLPFG